jgi:hypothetical protein
MKRGTPRHPKVAHLQALLRVKNIVPLPTVIGLLELLWHFTAEFAPQGDIGKFADDRIEAACDWYGRKGRLIEALIESRLVDRHPDPAIRLVVHDWNEHADNTVKNRLKRNELDFIVKSGKNPDGFRVDSGGGRDPDVTRTSPGTDPESTTDTAQQDSVKVTTDSLPARARASALPEPEPSKTAAALTVTGNVEKPNASPPFAYPKTLAHIKKCFPATDTEMVLRIAAAANEAAKQANCPDVDDDALLSAVQSVKNPDKSAAFYLKTVPPVIEAVLKERKRRNCRKCGGNGWYYDANHNHRNCECTGEPNYDSDCPKCHGSGLDISSTITKRCACREKKTA